MKVISTMIAALLVSSAAVAAIDVAWEGFSNPAILSSGFTNNVYSLPLEGATQYTGPKFWSGPYWANKQAGINYRWASPRRETFNYTSPNLNQLKKYSLNQMVGLSPSEKYDILTGRYDYPLKTQVASKVSPRAEDWEGICHGWVLAALHHAEPKPKTFRNKDGISIPFGSSDIKALLSYYYAESPELADQVGLRCNFGEWTGGARECDQDLNAGAFHIILTNKIGLEHEGFVMDVDRYQQVWNQPIIAYRSHELGRFYPSNTAARGTKFEIRFQTEVYYINEAEPSWNVVHGTDRQQMMYRTVQYRVEIDRNGNIIGGEWESEERPDFIWQKKAETNFTGLLYMLPQLLND